MVSGFERFQYHYKITLELNADGTDILDIEDLDIDFNIQRGVGSSVNRMTLRIYNLDVNYKKLYQARVDHTKPNSRIYRRVILQAGMEVNGKKRLSTIFRGGIVEAATKRENSDLITTIEAVDGVFGTEFTYANFYIPAGSSPQSIIEKLADAATTGTNVQKGKISPILLGDNLTKGFVLFGDPYDLLRRYTNNKVLVDLETLHVLDDNDATTPYVRRLDSSNHLFGVPELEGVAAVVMTDLIEHLNIGEFVEIESKIEPRFNGQYKIIALHYKGNISQTLGSTVSTKIKLFLGTDAKALVIL